MKIDFKSPEIASLVSSEEIEKMFEIISEGLQVVVNLTEEELQFSKTIVSSGKYEGIFNSSKKKCSALKVGCSTEDSGFFSFVMERSVGIRLAGMMMMMPEPTIKEKIENNELSPDDEEVLFEIGNILAGSLDDFIHQKHDNFTSRLKMEQYIEEDTLGELSSETGIQINSKISFLGKTEHVFSLFFNNQLITEIWAASIHEGEAGEEKAETSISDDFPKALIIQDEDDETRKMATFLEGKYFPIEVTDIGLAKDILGRERIDLVIVDMETQSPGGISIDKWIKAVTRTSRLPVIAISSRPTKSMVVSALKSGACDFIAVPWDLDKILTKIEEDLAQHALKMKKTL
ncbi:MAG: response regulator [Deltaproteobacteria bacterium]|nr:response regulator [Deltaproteobacteria bacterium]